MKLLSLVHLCLVTLIACWMEGAIASQTKHNPDESRPFLRLEMKDGSVYGYLPLSAKSESLYIIAELLHKDPIQLLLDANHPYGARITDVDLNVERALTFIVKAIEEKTEAEIENYFSGLSYFPREAYILWHEAYQQARAKGKIKAIAGKCERVIKAFQQEKFDKEATEWNNKIPGKNYSQEALRNTIQAAKEFLLRGQEAHLSMSSPAVQKLEQNIQSARSFLAPIEEILEPAYRAQSSPAATQPAATVQAPAAATVTPPAPVVTNPAPAQPSPKRPATKSFFGAHPWAKYCTYLVAGAAIVCSGYCLYKYADMGKFFTPRKLAKLVGIKA